MTSSLEELFTHFGTDKGVWGYSPAYERHLGGHRRFDVKKVLEIGICGFRDIPNNVVGASLFAWREFFPNADIYGLDNDPRFIFNDQFRIHTALCNAYDLRSLGTALSNWQPLAFDFICDDAVHDPLPQMELCRMLWPSLKSGGVYAIEDVCPYKCPNGSLESMISLLMQAHPDMRADEYSTHKAERLVILHKD